MGIGIWRTDGSGTDWLGRGTVCRWRVSFWVIDSVITSTTVVCYGIPRMFRSERLLRTRDRCGDACDDIVAVYPTCLAEILGAGDRSERSECCVATGRRTNPLRRRTRSNQWSAWIDAPTTWHLLSRFRRRHRQDAARTTTESFLSETATMADGCIVILKEEFSCCHTK